MKSALRLGRDASLLSRTATFSSSAGVRSGQSLNRGSGSRQRLGMRSHDSKQTSTFLHTSRHEAYSFLEESVWSNPSPPITGSIFRCRLLQYRFAFISTFIYLNR